jgi:uncharacterized protein (DUF58 family)
MIEWPDAGRMREIRASARRAAEVMRLPLGRRTWAGPAGGWSGSGRGISLEFQDHREYAPGDDPRHINWQAYARSDTYTMKMFREEVSPVADVLLDASASMLMAPAKRDRSLEVFCFAAGSAQAAGAALRAYVANGAGFRPVDPALAAPPELPPDPPRRVPAVAAMPLRPGGLRVLVTDCLFPEPPEELLRALVARRGRGLVLAPFAEHEARPRWSGETEFVDCETAETRRQRVDGAALARYHDAYGRHFGSWRAACVRWGVPFAQLPCEPDLLDVLRRQALPAGAVEPCR